MEKDHENTKSHAVQPILRRTNDIRGVTGGQYDPRRRPKQTNILIIWGDDIGYWKLSARSQKPGSFSIDQALASLLNAPKAPGD